MATHPHLPETMQAMVLDRPGAPLRLDRRPLPRPAGGQLLIRVRACGVCRTDLHIVDGDLPERRMPIIPGHEVVGTVAALGPGVTRFAVGDAVGAAWLARACGHCRFCTSGRENLCDTPEFTGYTIDGGYAQFMTAWADFCFPLPPAHADAAAAPLLCAGLIGYRSYRLCGERAERIGLYGFGASAHIIAQIAAHQGRRLFAFTRPGDAAGQRFARRLGAEWAGGSDEAPPEPLDAAIVFAPVGPLVPAALRTVDKGGRVVCAGIHMSDIPAFPYRILWEERRIQSVANLTRRDGEELLAAVDPAGVHTQIQTFPLAEANDALAALREGRIEGAAVLEIPPA